MSSDDSDDDSYKSAEDGLNNKFDHGNKLLSKKRPYVPLELNYTLSIKSAHLTAISQLLLQQSKDRKDAANTLFGQALYSEAIQNYERALQFCPNYLEYETAVLHSNISACCIKLEDWSAAVDSATKSLDYLERLRPSLTSSSVDRSVSVEVEVGPSQDYGAASAEGETPAEQEKDAIRVQKLRGKSLMRRGKARIELGGWSNLQGADEDYQILAMMQELSSTDRKIVDLALKSIPPKLQDAKEHEMGEMMSKLKGLGNGILRPFGLSTNNFSFVKDEKSGGYSMQFNQGK